MATPPVLSKVHTFAQDLETARAKRRTSKSSQPMTPAMGIPLPVPQSLPNQKKQTAKTELDQRAEKLITTPAAPIKLTTNGKSDTAYPATIITDKKRHRFNLAEEVGEAVTGWWDQKVKDRKKAKKKTYQVAPSELRKGVISTATTYTGRAATVDHKEIVAKLKVQKDTPVTKTPVVAPMPKATTTSDTTTWETADKKTNLEKTVVASTITDTNIEPVTTPTKTELVIDELTTLPETVALVNNPPADLAETAAVSELVTETEAQPSVIENEIVSSLPKLDINQTTEIEKPQPTASLIINYPENELLDEETGADRNSSVVVTEVVTRKPKILPTIPDVTFTENAIDLNDEVFTEEDQMESELEEVSPIVASTPTIPVIPEPRAFPVITPIMPAVESAPRAQNTSVNSTLSLMAEAANPIRSRLPDYVKDNIAARKESLSLNRTTAPTSSGRLLNLAPYLAGGLFLLVSLGSIAYIFISGSTKTPEPGIDISTNLPTGTTDLNNSTGTDLANFNNPVTAQLDAPNKLSLFSTIAAVTNSTDELQIITPLAYDTAIPLSTRDLLSLINRQLPTDFLGTIESLQVGMYNDNPVILLTVTSETNAQGGMFRWEKTLSQDLSPWFGAPIRQTGNNSLTGFTDDEIDDTDVRILKDDTGTTKITYGFINPTTILITTNTDTFKTLNGRY